MNWIFFALIVVSVLTAAFTGTMPKVTAASLNSTKAAVELSLGLIGQMTLWLGLVGIMREAGLLGSLANALRPLMRRLFPEVPADHPAMGAMILNLAANMLGLGNAATPFGLKAMQELDTLNSNKGVATNSMALFLAINTSAISIPLSAIAVRATLGSKDPAGIIVPTLLAASWSTVWAVLTCKVLENRAFFSAVPVQGTAQPVAPVIDTSAIQNAEALAAVRRQTPMWRLLLGVAISAVILFALVSHVMSAPGSQSGGDIFRSILSDWLLPLLILSIVTLGFGRQVKVYEAFIGAAKEGFQVVKSIFPFLVGVLFSIGMFRASGAMDAMVGVLSPLVTPLGFPPEAIPMALIRPLSGSGALGVMTDGLNIYGTDSFVGYLLSVLNGSTETTFYVLALYFGVVQVKVLRHTLVACLVADVMGPIGALLVCKMFFSGAP